MNSGKTSNSSAFVFAKLATQAVATHNEESYIKTIALDKGKDRSPRFARDDGNYLNFVFAKLATQAVATHNEEAYIKTITLDKGKDRSPRFARDDGNYLNFVFAKLATQAVAIHDYKYYLKRWITASLSVFAKASTRQALLVMTQKPVISSPTGLQSFYPEITFKNLIST